LFEPQRDKHTHVRPEIAGERREFIVELLRFSEFREPSSKVANSRTSTAATC
jgi:hypothetical protein